MATTDCKALPTSFDYIICGGGTAGCALAARLKQGDPKCSVALVERGLDAQRDPSVLTPLAGAKLPELGLVSIESSTPQDALDGRRIQLRSGKMLSGSSGVNAGLWMRGHSEDYDYWSKLTGDKRLSYQGLLPYFRRTETHHDPTASKEAHGFDGPIKTAIGPKYPLSQPVHDAYVELGLKDNPDANGGNPLGISVYTENWRPTRQPAGLAYDLTGVQVITDATVRKVLIDGATSGNDAKATGVEFVDGRQLQAAREVVVSCGSYRTPQVLMLSGIGPKSELSRLGVSLVVDSPDLGSNLFDHLGCFTCWRLTPSAVSQGVAMGSPDFMSKPGYLDGLPCDWMAIDSFASSELPDAPRADAPVATHWYNVMYMPIALEAGYDVQIDGAHVSMAVLNFQPTARGSVTVVSTDPSEAPMVDPKHLSTEHDRVLLRKALRKMLRLAESKALQPFIEGEVAPAGHAALNSQSSDEDIDARIRKYCGTIFHPAGTAAIGKVVDSELRVKGVDSLRVCDASVFPAPVSATTQATVYAIAEYLADVMLGRNTAAQ